MDNINNTIQPNSANNNAGMQNAVTPNPEEPHPQAHTPHPQTYTPYPPPGQYALSPPIPRENTFKPELLDFIFALVTFALGYLFSRWVLFNWQGWGVTVFTTAYLLTATAYLSKKGILTKSHEVWFWLAVTWLTGASYTLWENAGFPGVRALFLCCSAAYYIIVASGRTLLGKTSNYLPIDGINAVMLVPFRNIFNQYVSFTAVLKGKKRSAILPALLGIAIALIFAIILIPMLERADSGGFGIVLEFFRIDLWQIFFEIAFYVAFAIPCAAFMYGLISGAAHGKGVDIIKREPAEKAAVKLRVFHPATIYIVLSSVCTLYLVFILSQTPYFFSAFTGRRPEGWLIYSEYARHGFFELCIIAAINLTILTMSNLTCKKHRIDSKLLRVFNIALALITLVLIATAFSKMALYIGAYGLTMPRLLPCVFMVFLAAVFVTLIVLQKRDFSIVRFALITGAVIICVLSLSNPDAIVVRYNANRYLSGTLQEFDTEILYRAGSAGVASAIDMLEQTQDDTLRTELYQYLEYQHAVGTGSSREPQSFSIEAYRAWRAGQSLDFPSWRE